MKSFKILLIIAIYFTTSSFKPTEELKWMSWNEGYELAKKKKKIILVDCYTEWCGWCKRMDKDTYNNSDIQKKIGEHFVPVKLNPELNETFTLDGKQYNGRQLLDVISNNAGVTGYPTVIFIIPNGKTNLVELSVGYSNAAQFSTILDTMKAKQK